MSTYSCPDCGRQDIHADNTHCPECGNLLPLTSPEQGGMRKMGTASGCWIILCIIAAIYVVGFVNPRLLVVVGIVWMGGMVAIQYLFANKRDD